MRNVYRALALAVLAITLVSCQGESDKVIKVGVSYYPFYSSDSSNPDLLDIIEDDVSAQGYSLEKVVFLNYAEANPALAQGELDANLIQHRLYMELFNESYGAELTIVQAVYHATFALYSARYSSPEDVADGETVYIPNDGVNTARALLLLQSAGLIELADGAGYQASEADIVENPKNLRFEQVPLTAAAGSYDEAGRTLAVMYPTFARSLGLQGDAERIFLEPRNATSDAYAISLASRSANASDEKIQVLAQALRSDKVKNFLAEHYAWASVPAF